MTTVSDMTAAYKKALHTAARTAITDQEVLVAYGNPGPVQTLPDDIVSVGRVTGHFGPGPISATNRARDVTLTAWVTASCFRAGGWEQEEIAGDRAYELIGLLEEYVRVTDTTLGGLVYWCFCVDHDSEGYTSPEALAEGRTIEVVAQFEATARITS